jgi:hypothetical protein
MTQVTKARENGDLKIGAVMFQGRPIEPEQAVHDVAELFAMDIEGALRLSAPELATDSVHEIVVHALERRLSSMLEREKHPAAAPSLLPVSNLKPSEVVKQPGVQMSLATLYRYVDANRFYCVVPSGQRNGREFPAWQFVEPVPELLADVLTALRGAIRTEVHAFLVTAQDELNELSPAEVLAGAPFATRRERHASQTRLLRLGANERKRRVMNLIESSKRAVDA